MILFGVQHSKYNDRFAFNAEKEFVGETPQKHTAKTTIISWKSLGLSFQCLDRISQNPHQFTA